MNTYYNVFIFVHKMSLGGMRTIQLFFDNCLGIAVIHKYSGTLIKIWAYHF